MSNRDSPPCAGRGNVTSFGFFLRSIYCGNGFHRARAIERDHRVDVVDGRRLKFFEIGVMPEPFNWKMPSVSPRASISNVFVSSSGKFSISISMPRVFTHAFDRIGKNREVLNTEEVEFREDRRRRIRLIEYMSYCVMILPAFRVDWIGEPLIRGVGAMTTPAACTPTCRTQPSILLREVDDFARVVVFVIQHLQIRRHLERAIDRHREILASRSE